MRTEKKNTQYYGRASVLYVLYMLVYGIMSRRRDKYATSVRYC